MAENALAYHYVCGKCGSRGLYRDDDRRAGEACVACHTCGNRYYGDVATQHAGGVAPKKVFDYPKHTPEDVAGPSVSLADKTHIDVKSPRASVLQPEWKCGIQKDDIEEPGAQAPGCKMPEGEEIAMETEKEGVAAAPGKKKWPVRKSAACGNCGRVLTIQGKGRCGVCYQTGKKYPEGSEDQKKALAEVAKRVATTCPRNRSNRPVEPWGKIKTENAMPDHPREEAKRLAPTCRICGCTDDHACPGGCSWVAPDLCSACAIAKSTPDPDVTIDLKKCVGYRQQMPAGGAFYFLDLNEREIIDAVRLGKMILVLP